MKVVLFILAVLCLVGLVGTASATEYSWYFSQAGDDTTGDGSIGDPWQNLSKAQTEINNANSADICTLYFNRGDTWTKNTGAVSTTVIFGLLIDSTDPTTNLDAYGSGDKPIFDGLVSDFSSVPEHNGTNGPLFYSRFFEFNRDNCSIKNIEFKRIYGHCIFLAPSDFFTLQNCTINNFGAGGITTSASTGGNNITVENNTFHTGQELWRYSKRSGWEAAIQLMTQNHICKDNTIRYNIVYDIYGEGIQATNSLCEYNVVGDTFSIAINCAPQNWDALNTTIRYNFVIASNSSLSDYPDSTGIRVRDEYPGGDNSNANISIYGNIVINRGYGLRIVSPEDTGNPFGHVKIYNNMVIDSHLYNMYVGQPAEFTRIEIYNNLFILYNQTSSTHVIDYQDFLPNANWTIKNNSYWTTGGSPTVDSEWRTNYTITNPNLPGEGINWDNQTGVGYYNAINFNDHLYPPSDSVLIGAGKVLNATYNDSLLTYGTDFSTLPGSRDFVLLTQGAIWDTGAIIISATSPVTNITSWENNDTSDSTLDITVDIDQSVKFNATANQTITAWDWKVDSVDQSNNYNNITLDWSIPGEYIITVTAANANGTSSEIQWNVTVDDSTSWGDTDYSYRKYIIFDDALIYGTNTNFSVLINVTDTDLANNTQSDGGDIKFMIGGTQMPHDLVEYNGTSGYIRTWVRMSELSDTNRLLHIYYGNATVANQWNATETWQDYNLTFHMEGDPAAGVLDSSGNANGTATGLTSADEVTGKIGNATNFDGTNDYIQITGLLGEPANVTVSMWVNQTGNDTSGSSEVISLGDCLAIRLQPNWKAFYHHSGGYNPIDTTDNLLDDGWTYIAVTMQPDDQKVLKNAGVQLTAETNAQAIDYTGQGANTRVGSHGNAEVIYDFIGDMDEVRVTSLIRNADWIHTEYQNQDDPAGFATYGTEQSESGAADTKFEYWTGSAWQEGPSYYYLWFDCFWWTSGYPDGVAPNAEQSDSQPSLRVENNGSAAGTTKMKLSENPASTIKVFIDDDNTVAGAIELNDTYQVVGPSLNAGENTTFWAWTNLTGPTSTWDFDVYAINE